MYKFHKTYPLTTNDTDRYDKLSPCAILDLSQDIAGVHADILNIGFKTMFKKGYIWILARSKYEVFQYPPASTNIELITWPKIPSRIDLDRDCEFLDLNGNRLIRSTHKWCLFNINTQKLELPSILDLNKEEYCLDSLYEDRFRPLSPFNLSNPTYTFKVKPSHIDHNGHMNNTKYAEEILNALRLNKDEVIKTFEINFIKQCMLDDELSIAFNKNNKTIQIEIFKEQELVNRAYIELF